MTNTSPPALDTFAAAAAAIRLSGRRPTRLTLQEGRRLGIRPLRITPEGVTRSMSPTCARPIRSTLREGCRIRACCRASSTGR